MGNALTNKTKVLLRENKVGYGILSFLNDPALVEIAGLAGMDFMIFDMEHCPRNMETLENTVRAAELVGLTPIVRVADNDAKLIGLVLDTGVQGVVIPNVKTAADARRARDAVFYPPEGKRSVCSAARDARYASLRASFPEFLAERNQELLLIALIESREGIENIEAILDEGVDVVFIGRGDLSTALGFPYQYDHPVVAAAIDKVFRAAADRQHVWSGITTNGDDEGALRRGGQFLVHRDDTSMLLESYKTAISRFRATMDRIGAV